MHIYWTPERAVVLKTQEDTVYDVIETNPNQAIIDSLTKEG